MHLVLEILIAVLFLYLFAYLTSNRPQIPGPGLSDYLPGGSAYEIFKNPHALVGIVRKIAPKYGSVFQVRLGLTPCIITANPDDFLHIYSSPALFPRAMNLHTSFQSFASNGILTITGATHQAVRKKLRHDFNYNMLKSFHSDMVDAINELCDTLTSAVNKTSGKVALVDISEQLAVITFRVLTNVAFRTGLNREDRLAFAKLIDELVEELMAEFMYYPLRGWFSLFGTRRNLERVKNELNETCARFMKARLAESSDDRQSRGSDMLDAILELGSMDGVNAASMVAEFATAGSHTTNQLLSWAMYEVCCNPEVEQELVRQLDAHFADRSPTDSLTLEDMTQLEYVNGVWNEALRLHSVGAGTVKRNTADVTLKGSGTFIPKGSTIIPHHDRVHTEEEFWKDANAFKPERWMADESGRKMRHRPGTFVPFALGAHSCAGRFLADYEGPLILAELFRRFKFRLGCERNEVVSCSAFVESARTASKPGGPLDRGVPLLVELRNDH